jgi:hypothetical protein
MHLPLTQEDIGDATGLTGIHVNRVLGDFKTDGILTFSYRRLSILDPDKLVDVAGIDPELLHSWIRRPTPEQSTHDESVKRVPAFSLTKGLRRRLGQGDTGSSLAVAARCQA